MVVEESGARRLAVLVPLGGGRLRVAVLAPPLGAELRLAVRVPLGGGGLRVVVLALLLGGAPVLATGAVPVVGWVGVLATHPLTSRLTTPRQRKRFITLHSLRFIAETTY